MAARLVEPLQSNLNALLGHRKYKKLPWEQAKVGGMGDPVASLVVQGCWQADVHQAASQEDAALCLSAALMLQGTRCGSAHSPSFYHSFS